MYQIIEIKAKRTFACPGVYGYDAEAEIMNENFESGYVHVNFFDGFTSYSYAADSMFDFLTGKSDEEIDIEFTEEYSSLEEAAESEYLDIFVMLDEMLYQMINGVKKKRISVNYGEKKTNAEFDDFTYYNFGVSRAFEYEGETYEATAAVMSVEGQAYYITKKDELIESYSDIELAAYSKWFGVYLALKKELVELITEYMKNNKEKEESIAMILSALE